MRTAVYFFKSGVLFACVFGLITLSGCKPRLLPSTNVPVTRENQSIVKFLEQYKAAIEKRSVDAIMELVARDFSDNMGSEEPRLNMNYLRLKEQLEQKLPRIQDVRLGMFVQHIGKLETGLYEVVFYFNKHSLIEVPSGEKWFSKQEVNRMVIRRRTEKDAPYEYEIVSGI